MTIEAIKNQLSILTVLAHYGITVNRNNMIICPFHDDRKASMKVYPETNTVYCFAGGCTIDSMDVIDFIMKMENLDKHNAILKAKQLIGNTNLIPPIKIQSPKKEQVQLEHQSSPQLFASYRKALKRNTAAKKYCEDRGLDWQQLEIGYKSRKTQTRWGRACIIFPLKNQQGEIVGFYGRSIVSKSPHTGRHFYPTGGIKGLYPAYPCNNSNSGSTKKLILTESIIDAASLYQLEEIRKEYSILALYGTNGMRKEHIEAIKELQNLEQIIFFFDGDQAGQDALKKYALLFYRQPHITLKYVPIADNQDVNSTLVHQGREKLIELITTAKTITHTYQMQTNQNPPKNDNLVRNETKNANKLLDSRKLDSRRLDTSHKHNLKYTTPTATYYVKGGIRYADKDMDSLKITLEVVNAEGRKSRNRVDLYNDREVEKIARYVSEKLALQYDVVELDIHFMTDALEKYRETLRAAEEQESTPQLSQVASQRGIAFLKLKNLFQQLNQRIGKSGIVGEENARLLLLLIAASCKTERPLHALIQGSSGSGKTHLLHGILNLLPDLWVQRFTRITDSSLYNWGKKLMYKCLGIEDMDGLKEEAEFALRELQSNRSLRSSTSEKEESGKISAGAKETKGPISSLACTTKGEIYGDNASRCFLISVDESQAQTHRILDYQAQVASRSIDEEKQEKERQFIQSIVQLLKPVKVKNAYAPHLKVPDYADAQRRLNSLLHLLILEITRWHQYQRKQDQKGNYLSTKQDIIYAIDLMFESIVLKCDDLNDRERKFFEQLKKYIQGECQSDKLSFTFRARDIRLALRVSSSHVHRYLDALLRKEYIQKVGGNDYKGFHYKVTFWDNIEVLRNRIKHDLYGQLEDLHETENN